MSRCGFAAGYFVAPRYKYTRTRVCHLTTMICHFMTGSNQGTSQIAIAIGDQAASLSVSIVAVES
jgi:hypothetical protein